MIHFAIVLVVLWMLQGDGVASLDVGFGVEPDIGRTLRRVARHINPFGDVVLFSGWALLTGLLIFMMLPAAMICLLVFVNVPVQGRYLADRYGAEYAAYAARTARLFPYIY